MNKLIILNAVWVIVAIAAFMGGRTVEKSSSETEAALSEEEDRSLSPRSRRSSRGSSASGSGGSSANGSYGRGSASGVSVSQYQNETDALIANKIFADLLLNLDESNARSLFDALLEKQKNGSDTGQQMGLLLEAWGKLDGPAALAAVQEMGGDGRRRGFASVAAMRGWASTNPEAAKAHLAGLEGGFERGMLTQGVVSGMASSDPNAATAFVLELEAERDASGDGRNDRWRGFALDRQMEAIANAQIQRGMSDATAWAEGLPEGAVKSSAFDRVAESYAQNNPQEAAEWISGHADQEYAERAVREISEELSRNDPAAAMSWASDLPEATQPGAIRTAMERWTREDPTAAGQYLTNMEQSPSRDAAVSSFARSYDRENPAVAAEWAQSISNEQVRNETVESVARSWFRSNPEEARAWLPQSGLSAEAQNQIIERSSRDGRGRGPR